MKTYSLKKSKKVLLGVYHLWRRKRKRLLPAQVTEIQNDLRGLQDEILKKNREGAEYLAMKCEDYGSGILKKGTFEQIRDFILALVFALAVALIIRQMWFELYEIPTGSMRPTFKEKDRLIVSKTDFGINIPFTTKHLYFNPDLVQRAGTIVFTVANMDVHDPDTMYFWIFPGKKQFVKRMMGKPGDTLYFYGGKIYGINDKGEDISSELQRMSLDKIDHVPIFRFQGLVSVAEPYRSPHGNAYRISVIHHMNEPIARLSAVSNNRVEGEMINQPSIHNQSTPLTKNFYELWGIGNYGKARISTKEEIRPTLNRIGMDVGEEELYLELKHNPNFKKLEIGPDFYGRIRPQFLLSTSVFPLDKKHQKTLFENMYTARFRVKNGFVTQYRHEGIAYIGTHNMVRLEGVPDGTYEFYHGQGYKIGFGGTTIKLKPDHPLMQFSPNLFRKLFNYGVHFDKRLSQGSHYDNARFAYFREGDLYVMGAPIFKQGDPYLEAFVQNEVRRQADSPAQNRYIPFIDAGPPVKDGKVDVEKVKEFGLLIPEKSYMALGDNFSNSGDSREFGFVPQGNLRGAPSFIFWPFGSRFGPPNQPPYPWFSLPNIIIWTLGIFCLLCWYVVHRAHKKLPLKDL